MDAEVHTVDRLNALERENAHLRVMAASVRCPYGHRTLNGCDLGYPGCACMDDLTALQAYCPEDDNKPAVRLGKRLAKTEAQFAAVAKHLDDIAQEMETLATNLRYRLLDDTEVAQG